jgi:integral membrane sensor domain MASE1
VQRSAALVGNLPYLGKMMLIGAAYFIAAKFSLALAIPPGYASAVWPPSGIALAATLLLGHQVWPGIWLGAALANVTVESSFFSAAIMATGNTLEALVAAALIHQHVRNPGQFGRGEDVVKFIAFCALSAVVAATLAQLPLASGHSLSLQERLRNWWTWWQGDLTGMIIVAPLILSWLGGNSVLAWPMHKKVEAACFGLLLVLTATAITAGEGTYFAPFSVTFVSLPFIIWGAFRFGQREVATAIAVVCGVAVWYVLRRRDLFASVALNELLLMLLTFISMVVIAGFVLVAVLGERSKSIDELRSRYDALESSLKSQASALIPCFSGFYTAKRNDRMYTFTARWSRHGSVVLWDAEVRRGGQFAGKAAGHILNAEIGDKLESLIGTEVESAIEKQLQID